MTQLQARQVDFSEFVDAGPHAFSYANGARPETRLRRFLDRTLNVRGSGVVVRSLSKNTDPTFFFEISTTDDPTERVAHAADEYGECEYPYMLAVPVAEYLRHEPPPAPPPTSFAVLLERLPPA